MQLRIDSLDEDGRGVGEAGGREIHVPGTLPGEVIQCEIEHESPHAARAWARLVSVEKTSPERVPPSCPGFGRCGGCVLQHLAYPAQLTEKRRVVERAFAERGIDFPVADVVASPRELGWRNKAKFVVAPGLRYGSWAPGTHDFVDMAGCQVHEGPIDQVARLAVRLATAQRIAAYDEKTRKGELRYLVVRANADGEILVVFVARSLDAKPALATVAAQLRSERPEVVGVVLDVNDEPGNAIFSRREKDLVLDGRGALADTVGDVRLELSARAFFQVNRAQAARLYAEVARLVTGKRIIDLYCGVGGIALTLAKRGAHVLGIESHPGAVADARRSAKANGVDARFEVGDAASADLKGADTVVVNPPRKGLSAATKQALVAAGPKKIVYVSCGPRSLAADLVELGRAGWRIESVRPFDLMPGTPHVETVVSLVKAR